MLTNLLTSIVRGTRLHLQRALLLPVLAGTVMAGCGGATPPAPTSRLISTKPETRIARRRFKAELVDNTVQATAALEVECRTVETYTDDERASSWTACNATPPPSDLAALAGIPVILRAGSVELKAETDSNGTASFDLDPLRGSTSEPAEAVVSVEPANGAPIRKTVALDGAPALEAWRKAAQDRAAVARARQQADALARRDEQIAARQATVARQDALTNWFRKNVSISFSGYRYWEQEVCQNVVHHVVPCTSTGLISSDTFPFYTVAMTITNKSKTRLHCQVGTANDPPTILGLEAQPEEVMPLREIAPQQTASVRATPIRGVGVEMNRSFLIMCVGPTASVSREIQGFDAGSSKDVFITVMRNKAGDVKYMAREQ